MLQYLTLNGFSLPFALRISAYWPPVALQYSTHCFISSGVPLPALVQMYGSQPTSRHHAMNSSVPNVFGSVTPQTGSATGLRVLPTPSFQ
jgi:hypothetical protein